MPIEGITATDAGMMAGLFGIVGLLIDVLKKMLDGAMNKKKDAEVAAILASAFKEVHDAIRRSDDAAAQRGKDIMEIFHELRLDIASKRCPFQGKAKGGD